MHKIQQAVFCTVGNIDIKGKKIAPAQELIVINGVLQSATPRNPFNADSYMKLKPGWA